jgi:hypothetical protein
MMYLSPSLLHPRNGNLNKRTLDSNAKVIPGSSGTLNSSPEENSEKFLQLYIELLELGPPQCEKSPV